MDAVNGLNLRVQPGRCYGFFGRNGAGKTTTIKCLLKPWRPRRRKIGVLAAALALVAVASGFSSWLRIQPTLFGGTGSLVTVFRREHVLGILIIMVTAFAGGLWTSLLCRQMAVAFWFAILVPLVLYAACSLLLEQPYGKDDSLFRMAVLAVVSCGYAGAGYALARWLFIHAQDVQAQEASATATLSFLPGFASPMRQLPWAALLVKELRLYDGTLMTAGALLLLHLAALAAPIYFGSWASKYPFLEEDGWMLWFLAPLLVGCSAIAEERRARTLEGSLCLPIGRLRQFAIKLLVAFGLGIFLGAVMPWLVEHLQIGDDFRHLSNKEGVLPWLLLTAAVITAIGFYASSLSESLLQGLGGAVGLCATACLIPAYWFYILSYLNDSGALRITSDISATCWWVIIISPAVAAFFFLSYANFKQLRITWRVWIRNGFILLFVGFGPPSLFLLFN